MTCGPDVVDCLSDLLDALIQSQQPNPAELALTAAGVVVALASALVSALAVMVSVSVVRRDRRNESRAERQAIREQLRLWFAGLSESAPDDVKGGHRALDSKIKEDVSPLRYREIFDLMAWAETVHRQTLELQRQDSSMTLRLHAERMYAKWMFRDLIASWVLSPASNARAMRKLHQQGYASLKDLVIPDLELFARSNRPTDLP
jgi:hypothetical protein